MSRLLLTYYGDDFTGSTDALEQLSLAGLRTVLFIEPPTARQLKNFPGLQAVGVAGRTRSLAPAAMERELRPALQKLQALGARHVHYKVCSTFDSSPEIGSIGRVLDLAARMFPAQFIPMLAAAPALGRYTVFGTHFARFGTGGDGAVHRLDRHPAISQHPVTPMTEADLCRHLARQTRQPIALFDILQLALPAREARNELKKILTRRPGVVLFDALAGKDLELIGALMDAYASRKQPLFSVGSSGVEAALAAHFNRRGSRRGKPETGIPAPSSARADAVLIGSGSCSPVTARQINRALQLGIAGVPLDPNQFGQSGSRSAGEISRVASAAVKLLQNGRSVLIYTTGRGARPKLATRLQGRTAAILGTALGAVLREAAARSSVQRLCIAGGDTSSYAARALGIEALEMIAPLAPGAPLCRVFAPGSPVNGREAAFKGGQAGAEDFFERLLKGNS